MRWNQWHVKRKQSWARTTIYISKYSSCILLGEVLKSGAGVRKANGGHDDDDERCRRDGTG